MPAYSEAFLDRGGYDSAGDPVPRGGTPSAPAGPADLPVPPAVQNVFNDVLTTFNTPPSAPQGFFDQPPAPPLPSVVQNVLDQLFNNQGNGPATYTAPTPQSLSGIPAAGGGVVVAPTSNTNNIFNQIVNYFFGSDNGTGNQSVPGGAGANPAKLGQVASPDDKLAGQIVDTTQNKPTGKSAIAATIQGLDLPVIGKTGNLWLNLAVLIFIPAVVLAGLWLIVKAFKK